MFASHASRVLQRNLGGDEGDAAGAAHDAGRLAARVLLDPAVRRVRRGRVDVGGLERRGIEIAVDIDRLQHHRIVGRDAVELVEREAARLVGELLLRPAAEHRDPFAGRGGARPLGHQFQGAPARGDAVEAQLVVLGGADPVRVVVDQAGDHGAAGKIDDAGRRALELLDVGVAPTRDDALAADRQRLHDGEAIVDRDDLAVEQHRVGVLRERRHGQECEDAESDGAEHWRKSFPGDTISGRLPQCHHGAA